MIEKHKFIELSICFLIHVLYCGRYAVAVVELLLASSRYHVTLQNSHTDTNNKHAGA
jgi:hypothetical protein